MKSFEDEKASAVSLGLQDGGALLQIRSRQSCLVYCLMMSFYCAVGEVEGEAPREFRCRHHDILFFKGFTVPFCACVFVYQVTPLKL